MTPIVLEKKWRVEVFIWASQMKNLDVSRRCESTIHSVVQTLARWEAFSTNDSDATDRRSRSPLNL